MNIDIVLFAGRIVLVALLYIFLFAVIEDLNSLNGTLVNGRQLVEPATLREGDEVQIGDVVMKVNRR